MITVNELMSILSEVKGCTFASLSSENVTSGIRKVTENEGILLFSGGEDSGYERMVKRRLAEIGKDPDSFIVGDLPWGERVANTPLIEHKGKHYLQAVVLRDGGYRCFIGSQEVNCDDFFVPRGNNQGLPDDKAVKVRTYSLSGITELRLMGEQLG